MRLIDADKLIEELSKYLTNGKGGELEKEEYVRDEVIADIIFDVRESPTVEAVPITFITGWVHKNKLIPWGGLDWVFAIVNLVEDWHKKQNEYIKKDIL